MNADARPVPRQGAAGEQALPAAFERLFLEEYRRVAGIAYRVLGDVAEAEDVAQDVFLSFYRRWDLDGPRAAGWLHAAASHLALNAVRSRKRRSAREDRVGRDADRAIDPESAAISSEERARARAALARMPEASATLLVLRYSGLSYAEVAAALAIEVDQVGTRLRRAQELFRKEVLSGYA